jgi:ATP dependent DNA ligase domain
MNVATFAHKWRIRSGERLQLGRIPSPQDRGVRLLTRNGKDWTGRFPTIVEAAAGLKARSCLIDGEVVCCDSQYRESKLGYASRVRRQCHADCSGHRGRALRRCPRSTRAMPGSQPLLMLWTAPPLARKCAIDVGAVGAPTIRRSHHANGHDNRSRYRKVGFSNPRN